MSGRAVRQRDDVSALALALPAAAAALRLQGHALLEAADALGPMPAPSPPASKLAATVGRATAQPGMQSGLGLVECPPLPGPAGVTATSSEPSSSRAETPVAVGPHTPVTRFPVADAHQAHTYTSYPTL